MDGPEVKRLTWTSEIARSNHRAHADFPTTVSPFGRIFVDKGVRKSKCFACSEYIVKGTPRFVILTMRPQTLKFRNGGRSRHAKCFAHVSCIRKILKNIPAAKDHRQCLGCATMLTELVVRASTTRNGEWGWLCPKCFEGNMFVQCGMCSILYPKHMCSRAVKGVPSPEFDNDESKPPGTVICDSCSINYGIATLRSVTRQEKSDKQFDGRVRGAIAQLGEWFGSGDAEGTRATRQHR